MEFNKEEFEKPEKKSQLKKDNQVKLKKITFRENRKFDLHIGRNMITFKGRQSHDVPAGWIEHKDFNVIKHLFIIEGV